MHRKTKADPLVILFTEQAIKKHHNLVPGRSEEHFPLHPSSIVGILNMLYLGCTQTPLIQLNRFQHEVPKTQKERTVGQSQRTSLNF